MQVDEESFWFCSMVSGTRSSWEQRKRRYCVMKRCSYHRNAYRRAVYTRFNYPNTDYVFQAGDARYEDINHDGNIDYRDVYAWAMVTPVYRWLWF